jgi:hypothetical protein
MLAISIASGPVGLVSSFLPAQDVKSAAVVAMAISVLVVIYIIINLF